MLTESENRDSRKVVMPTSSLLYGQLAVPYTFCNKGLQCESYKTLVHLEVPNWKKYLVARKLGKAQPK